MAGRMPLVVILGATGAGKSKLALELAHHFKGEVISADAMQMYRGLDIVTNKVTPEEIAMAPHHMIGFLDPLSKCTVVDFRNQALPIVEDLLRRNVMPVICGGTNYYIESLLWKVLIDQGLDGSNESEIPILKEANNRPEDIPSLSSPSSKRPNHEKLSLPLGDLEPGDIFETSTMGARSKDLDDPDTSDEVLHEKLRDIDPDRAGQLHKTNRRKVLRSIQVFHQTGRRHSELLREQIQDGGNHLGGPLRFPNFLILWVQCDQEILDDRCDRRVDKMIQRGMIKELEDFHKEYNLKRQEPADYTLGIFQSIGFKEFHNYLMLKTKAEKESDLGQKYFQDGVEQLKMVTRKYARKQIKWMRNRFLDPRRQIPDVYAVDSSDPSQWNEQCLEPALELVQAHLENRTPLLKPLEKVQRDVLKAELEQKILDCPICQVQTLGQSQMEVHLRSKGHRAKLRRLNSPRLLVFKISKINKDLQASSEMALLQKMKAFTGHGFSELKTQLSDPEGIFRVRIKECDALRTLDELKDLGLELEMKSISSK
ncbi:hypothetical protein TCAL_11566 [Tigriopus californicus]|uniref:Uncharacterized protein n=1 Tax=Tigriopus californicus TaxID=6832 RepID=A0A553NDS7_TIGCA|nr:tRNA dimethylallyltransferase-like [Tigriopus californicus]TRY63565.1 hypothetical protein TCAL_11566 [Tigriopus californicus]